MLPCILLLVATTCTKFDIIYLLESCFSEIYMLASSKKIWTLSMVGMYDVAAIIRDLTHL